MTDQKFRLVTRADFDGVVCGALLNELAMIDDIVFVEPKDMQDGNVPVSDKDITTNLPYVESVHLCFDHHVSELERVGSQDNLINDPDAPSAARVVYEHFGGNDGFPEISTELMEAVDQADAAQYTAEDIMAPEKWTLLNFIMDPRTGIDRFKEFAISNDQLMTDLMTYCRHNPVEEILTLPDVSERVATYNYHAEFAELQISRCSKVHGNLVVTDLRGEDLIYTVNRFMVYALYPDCNVSMTIQPGPRSGVTSIGVGKSILDRSSNTNVGSLMLEFGGGGHAAAGTCRPDDDQAEDVIAELIQRINADG